MIVGGGSISDHGGFISTAGTCRSNGHVQDDAGHDEDGHCSGVPSDPCSPFWDAFEASCWAPGIANLELFAEGLSL